LPPHPTNKQTNNITYIYILSMMVVDDLLVVGVGVVVEMGRQHVAEGGRGG
jgi:hypothetical protein